MLGRNRSSNGSSSVCVYIFCADGMPIYEGDNRIWQHYKAKLEREAVNQLQPQNNPLMLITEYFPEVEIVDGPVLDGSIFFSARLYTVLLFMCRLHLFEYLPP